MRCRDLALPELARAVGVDLDAVAVGVAEVDRLADEVVGGARQRARGRARRARASGPGRPVGHEQREVEEAGVARTPAARPAPRRAPAGAVRRRRATRGRRPARARSRPIAPVVVERALEVGDRQVDRAHVRCWDRHAHASATCGRIQAASASRSPCVSSCPTGLAPSTCTSAPPAASSSASSLDLLRRAVRVGIAGRDQDVGAAQRQRRVGPIGQHRPQQRGAAQHAAVAEEQLDGDVGAVRVAERDHAPRVAPVVRAAASRSTRELVAARAAGRRDRGRRCRAVRRSAGPLRPRAPCRAGSAARPSARAGGRGRSAGARRRRCRAAAGASPGRCPARSGGRTRRRRSRGVGPPRADVGEGRQHRLDALAQVLVVGRQRELLAEVLERLVDGEARARAWRSRRGRRSARGSRSSGSRSGRSPASAGRRPRSPARATPRARRSSRPRRRGGRCRRPARAPGSGGGVVEVEAAALSPRASQPSSTRLELERSSSSRALASGARAVGAHRVEALQRQLGRHLGVVGDQRLVGDVDDEQLVVEPLGVGEAQALARRARTRRRGAPSRSAQKSSASLEPTRQTIRWTIPGPGPARRHARELEEGQVGAGAALLVGEEEVVDGRVVLVDGFLDQPQPQHARRRSRRCAGRRR